MENVPDRAAEWWRQSKDDRALMAKLRRVRAPEEAIAIDGFMGFHRRLGGKREFVVRHAHLARVLAHVRENSPTPMPRALAGDSSGHPAMSESRLRRLLQIEASEVGELARALVRVVRLLKGRANVRDLTAAMLFWNDKLKTDWAYAYFGAADAASTLSPETEDAQ